MKSFDSKSRKNDIFFTIKLFNLWYYWKLSLINGKKDEEELIHKLTNTISLSTIQYLWLYIHVNCLWWKIHSSPLPSTIAARPTAGKKCSYYEPFYYKMFDDYHLYVPLLKLTIEWMNKTNCSGNKVTHL